MLYNELNEKIMRENIIKLSEYLESRGCVFFNKREWLAYSLSKASGVDMSQVSKFIFIMTKYHRCKYINGCAYFDINYLNKLYKLNELDKLYKLNKLNNNHNNNLNKLDNTNTNIEKTNVDNLDNLNNLNNVNKLNNLDNYSWDELLEELEDRKGEI